MASPLAEIAFAKLNLALHVRERMADGYHRIETLFAFCEDGDVLTAEAADSLSLAVTGPFAGALDGGNLVLKAAEALRAAAGVTAGARLLLDKRLPVASGLGGGSADAAAALRLLARLWDLIPPPIHGGPPPLRLVRGTSRAAARLGGGQAEADLESIAARLGADVPACLASHAARGEGRGDTLSPADNAPPPGIPVLIVHGGHPLSTAAVFAAWDGVDRGPLGDWRDGRNDLQPAAVSLAPGIAGLLASLEGAATVRMSGSGAACYGLYASEAERDAAADRIAAREPGWWLLRTRLRS